MNYFRIYCTFN